MTSQPAERRSLRPARPVKCAGPQDCSFSKQSQVLDGLWGDIVALITPAPISNPSRTLLLVIPRKTQVHQVRLQCNHHFGLSLPRMSRHICGLSSSENLPRSIWLFLPLLPISFIRLSQILACPRFLGFLPDSPVAFEIVMSPCLRSGTCGSRLVTILSDVIYF